MKNVSDEELRGHPKVNLSGRVRKRGARWGPWQQQGCGGFLAALVGCWEEKVSGKGHMRTNSGYRSANLADSYFKSSPAFTDCNKKLLNFLCDLTVFLSG